MIDKLNNYKAWAEKDTKFGIENMDVFSARLPYVISKWQREFTDESFILKKLLREHDATKRLRYHHLKTKSNTIMKNESMINNYLQGDTEYLESKQKVDEQEEICKFLEATIQTLQSCSFNISNAIKWQIFKSGNE